MQDRLTVETISETNLTTTKLAYLSICSTAENKAWEFSDEVLHVVSGFLVAAFPHVVSCLWPANDRICVKIAKDFYPSLCEQDKSPWQDGQTAAALRKR